MTNTAEIHQSLDFKEHFLEQGYVVIDEAFRREDLVAFHNTLKRIVTHVVERASLKYPQLKDIEIGEYCDEGLLALRYTDPQYVSVVQRLISRSPEFFRLSSEPKVFNTIRYLLGLPDDSPFYLLSNGVVFTNPHDRENTRSSNFELEWHQDTFFTIPRSRYVQFWGPLLRNSITETGTLRVCPASHKHGYGKQLIHPECSFNHRFSMAPGEISKYQQISVELELGQLLIFHGQLIHASGYNSSNTIRTTILGLCHDASKNECVPVSTQYRYYDQTPEAWFYDVYKDEKAKSIMNDQLAPEGEPRGGV